MILYKYYDTILINVTYHIRCSQCGFEPIIVMITRCGNNAGTIASLVSFPRESNVRFVTNSAVKRNTKVALTAPQCPTPCDIPTDFASVLRGWARANTRHRVQFANVSVNAHKTCKVPYKHRSKSYLVHHIEFVLLLILFAL